MSQKVYSSLLSLSVLATIIVNALSNILPFNGQTTQVVSDKYFTFFTPAGFTFVIWGVIYIGWVAIAAYSWIQFSEKVRQITPWFILGSLANMLWLVLWHYEILWLSVIVMLVILVSLIRIYQTLGIGVQQVDARTKWLLHLPISVYLGWISVATIANIASTLTQAQWNGLGIPGQTWSMLMLIVAGILAGLMLMRRNDFGFTAVVVWAAVGIASNFSSSSQPVMITAVIVAVVLGALILTKAVIRKSGSGRQN